jgi:hypothetical protein
VNGTGDGGDNKGEIKVIVRTLATAFVMCVIGLFALIYNDKKIPTEMWLLTTNVGTALMTMLVKTSPTASTPPDKPTQPTGEIRVPEQKLETAT